MDHIQVLCNADLEISTASDNSQGAHEHDGHDEDEADTSDVGIPSRHSKHSWHGGKYPVDVAPLVSLRVRKTGLAMGDGGVDGQPWDKEI